MQLAAPAARAFLASQMFPVEQTQPALIAWDWHWKRSPGDTPAEIEKLTEMARAARDFLSAIAAGHTPRWLTFTGPPGCGKTHLAERIRSCLRARGERWYQTYGLPAGAQSDYTRLYPYVQEGPLFTKWSRLLEHAREGHYAPLRLAGRDHYKIIDDLGADSFDRTAQATVFATQKMAELLDRRLGKWTVITTNFTRRDLARNFDPRISSRLLRGGNVVIDCGDLRDFYLRKIPPVGGK